MKFVILLFLLSFNVLATSFVDLQFGSSQIADSQWNVSSCLYTNTCQIYSKNPGTMYKIPWTSGQWSWASGQYVKFEPSGNSSFPWIAKVYNSNGSLAGTIGTGKVVNLGTDSSGKAYFFFVGTDNNTGQLFSMSQGMNTTSGITFTGTLNPDVTTLNTYANNYGSTTALSPGQTYTPAPSLCCGGSATFSPNAVNVAKLNTFKNRTTQDSQVTIEQIGNNNTIVVDQSGTINNSVKYYGNGSYNSATITQSSSNSTATNYSEVSVTGSDNTLSVAQQSSGGTKSSFIDVSGNNNNVTLLQKDNGNDYASIVVTGGNKSVNLTQSGSAAHSADVTLSGQPVNLTLTQSGSTQQNYSINFNCATAGGCSAIQVQQGN